MKKILLFVIAFAFVNTLTAHKTDDKQHKIIFQLATEDTKAHKALIKQLNNIATGSPFTTLQVVCQEHGLDVLVTDKRLVH